MLRRGLVKGLFSASLRPVLSRPSSFKHFIPKEMHQEYAAGCTALSADKLETAYLHFKEVFPKLNVSNLRHIKSIYDYSKWKGPTLSEDSFILLMQKDQNAKAACTTITDVLDSKFIEQIKKFAVNQVSRYSSNLDHVSNIQQILQKWNMVTPENKMKLVMNVHAAKSLDRIFIRADVPEESRQIFFDILMNNADVAPRLVANNNEAITLKKLNVFINSIDTQKRKAPAEEPSNGLKP